MKWPFRKPESSNREALLADMEATSRAIAVHRDRPPSEVAGVLTIHARAHREVPMASRPVGYEDSFLITPGSAWLHYRSTSGEVETTFSRGLACIRDAELGECGEASRSTALNREQEKVLFASVERREHLERTGARRPYEEGLDCARYAALIWRAVTGEALRSTYSGFFNSSTLAESIEIANARERLVGLQRESGATRHDAELDEEEERSC